MPYQTALNVHSSVVVAILASFGLVTTDVGIPSCYQRTVQTVVVVICYGATGLRRKALLLLLLTMMLMYS